MQNRRYTTEGIILSKVNYGEADRIVTLLTRDYGKVRVMAKGVRKIKSRKRGHLEVFNQVRFSAVIIHDMDLMTEVELIEGHSQMKKDLKKVSVAYYLVEIITKLTQTDDRIEFLYGFLVDKLHELEDVQGLKEFRRDAAEELLIRIGFWPHGKKLERPDDIIEDIIEKKISSIRIGKQIAT